eukprot:SAG31_NODE_2167_length_6269_cov_4.097731_7_plen_142_part_00
MIMMAPPPPPSQTTRVAGASPLLQPRSRAPSSLDAELHSNNNNHDATAARLHHLGCCALPDRAPSTVAHQTARPSRSTAPLPRRAQWRSQGAARLQRRQLPRPEVALEPQAHATRVNSSTETTTHGHPFVRVQEMRRARTV